MSATNVIARLRELRAKATGGTWFSESARVNASNSDESDRFYPEAFTVADCDMDVRIDHDTTATANAAAIVAAMNSLEPLLACAEALETVRGCGVLPISVGRIVDAALQALAEGGAS